MLLLSQNKNSAHFLLPPFPVSERNAVQREEGTQLLSGTENSSRKSQARKSQPEDPLGQVPRKESKAIGCDLMGLQLILVQKECPRQGLLR